MGTKCDITEGRKHTGYNVIYDHSRPAPIGKVHAAEAVSTLEAIGIMRIVLDAAVGVRNGQVIDSHVIWTLNVGVIPEK